MCAMWKNFSAVCEWVSALRNCSFLNAGMFVFFPKNDSGTVTAKKDYRTLSSQVTSVSGWATLLYCCMINRKDGPRWLYFTSSFLTTVLKVLKKQIIEPWISRFISAVIQSYNDRLCFLPAGCSVHLVHGVLPHFTCTGSGRLLNM